MVKEIFISDILVWHSEPELEVTRFLLDNFGSPVHINQLIGAIYPKSYLENVSTHIDKVRKGHFFKIIHNTRQNLDFLFALYSVSNTGLYILSERRVHNRPLKFDNFRPIPDWLKENKEFFGVFEKARELRQINGRNPDRLKCVLSTGGYNLMSNLTWIFLIIKILHWLTWEKLWLIRNEK